MKKLVSLIILSATMLVGCSSNSIYDLQDYYLELSNKNLGEISLKEVKKNLDNYKYEKETIELSKEEAIDGQKMDDISYHRFTDEKGAKLEISCNDKTEVVDLLSLRVEENQDVKDILYSEGFLMGKLSTTNIESIESLLDKLELHNSLDNITRQYLKLMEDLDKDAIKNIEEAKNILKLKNFTKEANVELDSVNHSFSTYNDYIGIDVTEHNGTIDYTSARINNENLNYNITIDYFDGKFNLTIVPYFDDKLMGDVDAISQLAKSDNSKIYDYMLNAKGIDLYKKEVTKEDEKQYKMLSGVVDIKKDRIMNEFFGREVEQLYDYGQSKSFVFSLEKNQGLKLDVNIKDLKEIKTPMEITLIEDGKGYIYQKNIVDLNEKTFIIPKVEHDGKYILSFDFKESEDFTFDLFTINEM